MQQQILNNDKKIMAKITLDETDLYIIKKLIAKEITKNEKVNIKDMYVMNLKRLYDVLSKVNKILTTENDRLDNVFEVVSEGNVINKIVSVAKSDSE